ncbi:MAG: ABC transporter ATP-binding protein [Cyanobacteria bacterium]|nr:ABC transporter ATP-binding protein [Cyanobacteria bacterium CG_2015-16_32_12]NCO78372.1 ABC transporter ATP-binding protein [Cyanobacteria bacterium CG_2015-22_32_23]NCQ02941.1 ABC transporter ATP-binding protein [Cyanobacteria bacterium CG_2015-09_32_10]NCQ41851.1 ABC transporter ATP-binding protein [Cyanobacteria bacterium CG_2015-04_32_10]NCS85873.1 ABC transporter ATP-binding protein [Cyanobacteria bacterium CG_2015-02_32_10]
MDKLDQKKSVIITVDNIKFDYEKQSILQGISFNLKAGERVALLGRTGAGKSTLLNNLIGLKFPQKGEIIIDGLKLEKKNIADIRKNIGFAFQNPEDQLFMPTILEDVMFGLLNYKIPASIAKEKARFLLDKFGLIAYENRSSHELSGGQKRLAALASILALEPNILILDEPTNGLDPAWRKKLAEILLNLPIKVILIASHDLNWVKKTTQRALILDQGQIQLDQSIISLFQQESVLESYGLPLDW